MKLNCPFAVSTLLSDTVLTNCDGLGGGMCCPVNGRLAAAARELQVHYQVMKRSE